MVNQLFSDLPVGGASNFQSRVDQMCKEINEENSERSDEEKGVITSLLPASVDVTPEKVETTEVPIEEKKVEGDDTLSKLTT